MADVKSVAVIGAGVAGLATARVLLQQGIDCTLFERASVLGGVWMAGYSNFGVQVPRDLYEFPDWPLPKGTANFTPGPVIQKYLEDYAEHFAITPCIRFNADVTNIAERDGPGSGWTVAWQQNGEAQSTSFDMVVVCIGLYSNKPHMPDFWRRQQERAAQKLEALRDQRHVFLGTGSDFGALRQGERRAREAHVLTVLVTLAGDRLCPKSVPARERVRIEARDHPHVRERHVPA